jgi:hypothetical protein
MLIFLLFILFITMFSLCLFLLRLCLFFVIIWFSIIMLSLFLFLLLFCLVHVKLFFTCNTTCLILLLVNVHENHEQGIYNSFIENGYFVIVIKDVFYIRPCSNEIETCHNCNLLYSKYSTVSIHKLSRVIFLDPLFIQFTWSLQGLFYLELFQLQ